jgi:hypothetical protein
VDRAPDKPGRLAKAKPAASSNARARIGVTNFHVEIDAKRILRRQLLKDGSRNIAILVDASTVKLDLERSRPRIITNRPHT